MRLSFRNMFALPVFILLYISVLCLHSYYYKKREEAQQLVINLNKYPLNTSEIKFVKEEHNFENRFTLKDSTQKQTKPARKKICVQSRMGHAANRGKSSYSDDKYSCVKRDVKLSETELPVTGLVSFPGSGNTWTRHLIQQLTGIGTSSVYCDSVLRSRGFPFECKNQNARTIVVKTHSAIHLSKFKKIVLLVRNPYDALLSFSNYATAGHTGRASKKVLIKTSFNMFNYNLRWYVNLIKTTITKFKGPVHVVQYERLKTDMASELSALATFLNANVTGYDIACTVKCQEGNFHRQMSDEQHMGHLRSIYDKGKLLRLRGSARTCEKVLKEAYNVSLDLGNPVDCF